jgi:hypothetical protein
MMSTCTCLAKRSLRECVVQRQQFKLSLLKLPLSPAQTQHILTSTLSIIIIGSRKTGDFQVFQRKWHPTEQTVCTVLLLSVRKNVQLNPTMPMTTLFY